MASRATAVFPVTDNQLTLATANGNHGIDGLEARLDGLVHGSSRQNTGGLELRTALLLGVDRTLAINGVTQGIDDTAKHFRTNGDIDLGRVS
jgi:hypothetical protein